MFYEIEKANLEILQKNHFLGEIEPHLYEQTVVKIQNEISQLKKIKNDNNLYLIIPDEFSSIKYDLVNKFYYVRLFGKDFKFVNIITKLEYQYFYQNPSYNNLYIQSNLIYVLNPNYYLSSK